MAGVNTFKQRKEFPAGSRRESTAILRCCRIFLIILGLATGAPAWADASFALDQTTASLPINSRAGAFTIGLSATGLDPKAPNAITVTEFGPDGPTVRITASRLSFSGATAIWKVAGTVQNFSASDAQARHLVITLDGKAQPALAYTLKNTAPGDFSWAISGLSDKRIWTSDDDIGFVVQVGSVPAHNVHLVQSDLVGTDNLTPLKANFKLCIADQPCDGHGLTLAASTSYSLLLRARDHRDASPGRYAGTLLLAADEKPLGDNLPIVLVVTSLCAKWTGFILLCLGVVASLIVNPFARARVARTQALRPAAVLRERAIDLSRRIREVEKEAGGRELPCARSIIEKVETDLSTRQLVNAGYVPGSLAVYYNPASTAPSGSSYQTLLTTASNQLSSLAIILERGVRAALAAKGAAAHHDVVDAAIGDLDSYLGNPDVAANQALADKITTRLAKLDSDIDAATQKAALDDSDDDVPTTALREPTTHQLDFEIHALNMAGWLFFAFVSIISGWIVLIILNPAFGSLQDLAFCLLWGFGLPSAGQQLSSVSQPAIATSLGVKLVG